MAISGKVRNVRYSPTIMRLALSLWSKAGNTVYKELREFIFITLPSRQILQASLKELTIPEGYVSTFEFFRYASQRTKYESQ